MGLLSVASYNIQYSLGADNQYDLARTIEAIRDADVICLQEIDCNWRRTNMVDQAAEIQRLLPDRFCVFGPSLDVDASVVNPDRTVNNRRRQSGQMTISRYPIASSRVIHLPKQDTGPSMNSWAVAVESVIMTPDRPVRVINLHLTDISESNRISQILAVLKHCEDATLEGGAWNGTEQVDEYREHWQLNDPTPPMPHEIIIAGDFNDEPDSRVVDLITQAGYVDSWTESDSTASSVATFKTNPEQGTDHDIRIDYIFVSPYFEIVNSYIDGLNSASDHQPVWAILR